MSTSYYIDYWGFQPIFNGEDYYYLYMPFFAPGPGGSIRNSTISLGKTYANVDAKPRVAVGTPTLSNDPVTVNAPQTTLTVPISASSVGLQDGDYAVVEVIDETTGATIDFTGGPSKSVTLSRGGTATTAFQVVSASEATHNLRVRIADILRPNPQGNPISILSQAAVNSEGSLIPLHVNH